MRILDNNNHPQLDDCIVYLDFADGVKVDNHQMYCDDIVVEDYVVVVVVEDDDDDNRNRDVGEEGGMIDTIDSFHSLMASIDYVRIVLNCIAIHHLHDNIDWMDSGLS